MTVRQAVIKDKDVWNAFTEMNSEASFLQTWQWGEMQRELKVPFWRLVAEDSAGWQAVALVVKRKLPLGVSWLYVPRGPVFKDTKAWPELEKSLIGLTRKEKAMFVRMDPAIGEKDNFALSGERERSLWRKADREVQPKNTMVTDISAEEVELLAGMHAKTRYNVRLAERRGVKIRFSQDIKDLDKFFALAGQVSRRSDFRFHPQEYYRTMFEQLAPINKLEIALAEYEGHVLAVNIVIMNGWTAIYAHGASSSKYRNLMAPYLLQWETIRRMKKKGFKYYDWFGTSPPEADESHPWHGITRFKTGFGGRRIEYAGAYDYVARPFLYKVFDFIRNRRHK